MKTLIAILLTLASFTATASTIYPSGTVTNSGGFKYIELQGYRFETPNYGTLLQYKGGLWDGNSFGTTTPLTIARVDGGEFSAESFLITTSAAFACGGNWCGIDNLTVTGFDGAAFGEEFRTSGYADALSTFTLTDPRWQHVTSLMISTPDSFVLHSINLTAVPLPGAAWLFLAGLLAFIRKRSMYVRK